MKRPCTIWIDLDNSPHVPFFRPIIEALESQGHRVVITTRDCFQVCALAKYHGLKSEQIGKHYGANRLLKVLGTLWRALQLMPTIVRQRPDLSLSHGSRPLVILSSFLRIPTILMFDYEHAQTLPFIRPELGLAPESLRGTASSKRFRQGLLFYPGLKEDVYVPSFTPNSSVLSTLGLSGDEIVATIRPPATEAHYHNRESERLYVEVVDFLASVPNLKMVILPRNEKTQRDFITATWPDLCEQKRIIIPSTVVDGLNLVWHSDLVVSGGGTMNREAAALGVPVYSIFRGQMGSVDRYLSETGRLTLIQSVEEVRRKIEPVRRKTSGCHRTDSNGALSFILNATNALLARRSAAGAHTAVDKVGPIPSKSNLDVAK
jgi:predicted glycosyltransferase